MLVVLLLFLLFSPLHLLSDVDFGPRKAARDERKARVAKNEKQQLANAVRAQTSGSNSRGERKQEIDRTLASSRISTASMGKFDKKLDGEKKLRGVKRKFQPNEASVDAETKGSLVLLSKKTRRDGPVPDESALNVRKAVRFASKGQGGVALGRQAAGGRKRLERRGVEDLVVLFLR
ncbi:Rhodanese-related sulfurtransferase [Stygiomarasmius scandens]|uniref:Rhodanese-related sulfurtransferase n=1 Tax=Marasmiellus scandens TaxID=2682957 RepID=A0ABR1JZJ1_9AGAR